MDAALCINTLDQLSTTPEVPVVPDFALIDLAGTPEFLKTLYSAMDRGPIRWTSLLEGTRWQSGWQFGPILVDLRGRADFQAIVTDILTAGAIGNLIKNSLDYEQTLAWSRSRLFALAKSDDRLLRFYDPRSLKALLAALGPRTQGLLPPDWMLLWHDTAQWLSWPDHSEIKPGLPALEWKLSESQLGSLPDYRMADRAGRWASVYNDHLSSDGDKRLWVLEQLRHAHDHGFLKVAQQERWLRLAIQSDAPLLSDSAFRALVENADMTDEDRLEAMECLVESYHATA
ncbi:hypothetical protein LCGC14_1399970 [marine sediment metagenome]|uniref:DUF4123 domain-containing protein n=1 Tax=marine sediment metagenome TaxID=412755 RepID=A0A0F9JXD8_9ZZZZ